MKKINLLLFFLVACQSKEPAPSAELTEHLKTLTTNFTTTVIFDSRIDSRLMTYCDKENNHLWLNPSVWNSPLTKERKELLSQEVAVCWLLSQK